MKIAAVYENGVFRPLERPRIPDRQQVVMEYWLEQAPPPDLVTAYREASGTRGDLEDWSALDTEGWE